MREWEIRWVKRGDPVPLDGEFVKMPDYYHHGRYVEGMIVREIKQEPEHCPFCNSTERPEPIHGHYQCPTCKQVTSTCCPGSGEGESG